MDVRSWRRALVLGAGRSGRAAALALQQRGVVVTLVDSAVLDASQMQPLVEVGITILQDVDPAVLPALMSLDGAVVSPGIGRAAPWCQQLIERGVPLIGELELGAQLCESRILAITGTNGKSTLVKLCADHLNSVGCTAVAGGNYGVPLTEIAQRMPPPDWVVLEASTFQLETTVSLRPEVAVLLNIQPDHLDRHSAADYRALKFSLFANMREGTGIVPVDLLAEARERNPRLARWVTFGAEPAADYRVLADGERVACPALADEWELTDSIFANPVLAATAAAFVAAIHTCHPASLSAVPTSLRRMKGLAHRFEIVAKKGGVTFIDDSKATNLAALAAALEMSAAPVRLIAGGVLKEKEVDSIKEVLARRTRSVYLMGEAAAQLRESWGESTPCRCFDGLDEAFDAAWRDAMAGETVLLAPGCASFDQYTDYAARGRHFQERVDSIEENLR